MQWHPTRWFRAPPVLLTAGSVLLAACGTSASTMDPASAKADIGRAYGTLFNFTNKDVAPKLARIQDGTSLRAAITEALSSSLASAATGARVERVELLSAARCSQVPLASPCAKVGYDLIGTNGAPLFPTTSTGYALYTNGKWLVAKSTICSLLGLFYSASGKSGTPPGC